MFNKQFLVDEHLQTPRRKRASGAASLVKDFRRGEGHPEDRRDDETGVRMNRGKQKNEIVPNLAAVFWFLIGQKSFYETWSKLRGERRQDHPRYITAS